MATTINSVDPRTGDAPEALLPPELRADNPLGIWRRVDGELTREPLG